MLLQSMCDEAATSTDMGLEIEYLEVNDCRWQNYRSATNARQVRHW